MLADLFYKELLRIYRSDKLSDAEKCQSLERTLNALFRELTSGEKLLFTTMFARIAYACHLHQVPDVWQRYVHTFRRATYDLYHRGREYQPAAELAFGLTVLGNIIHLVTGIPMPDDVAVLMEEDVSGFVSQVKIVRRSEFLRVLAMRIVHSERCIYAKTDDAEARNVRILYDLPERNECFTDNIKKLEGVFGLPVTLMLLDIEEDETGALRPSGMVVEPDYMVDVTAVAECFKGEQSFPVLALVKKFIPSETTQPMMLGNVANFFLDELMNDPEADFREMFRRTFRQMPLAYCVMNDKQVSELYNDAQSHFLNIRQLIRSKWEDTGLERESCYLEPSFIAPQYGLQGRLDAFFMDAQQPEAAIVELKSGSPFMPNVHGIGANHFVQTLLYDLLVKAAYNKALNTRNYILYSKLDRNLFRFAPVASGFQTEALQVRNAIVIGERALVRLSEKPLVDPGLIESLRPERFPNIFGFDKKHLNSFFEAFIQAPLMVRKYFKAFASFVAREQMLAKIGAEDTDKSNGLAALWLNDDRTKDDNYSILRALQIGLNESDQEDPFITFERTTLTSGLANFREGDIGILYPSANQAQLTMGGQVFKCTIVGIDSQMVKVRLRYKVFNQRLFQSFDLWNIEPDLIDSSFNGQYQSLFRFLKADDDKRQLWLGLKPPSGVGERSTYDDNSQVYQTADLSVTANMTPEQSEIFKRLLAAKDYFLLWGPPGTGKTSVMLRYLAHHLMQHTSERLLLMAYTNRAVDEICEALERNGLYIRDLYMRIGSRYGTAETFHDQLFDSKIAHVKTRKELRATVEKHRIIVATVASMQTKTELFDLIKFDRVIIDEASQILEPNLVGLLPRFPSVVLIGDHKQLPAVVTQPEDESATNDADLHTIGLTNLRNSLFERLFKRCVQQGWHHAYAQLSHQGRMHQDIMDFPGRHFYGGKLNILPEPFSYRTVQMTENPFSKLPETTDKLTETLKRKRLHFFSTPPDTDSPSGKTNVHEARLVADLVSAYRDLFRQNGQQLGPNSIGIITPFRAQIARIREALRAIGETDTDLTIDTVERYQGGARDVILFTLCTNRDIMRTTLISLNDEGVDRKLNVALTRARHHLVIVGNDNLLENSPLYKLLMHEGRS